MTTARKILPYRVNLKIEPGYRRQLEEKALRGAARAALVQQAAPAPSELTVMVAGDGELRALNRQFLGHDRPTDVLSFPQNEPDPVSSRLYLGDIAISFPQAREQAKLGRHPIKAELQLLVVHGVLHLLGHDHAAPGEMARMWAAQAAILRQLKAGITGPVEE